ncbi:uncharacterized protein BCR38DRAFT_322108, partial [Pseudomassariella vexata]
MHLLPRELHDEDIFIQMVSTPQPAAHAGDPLDDVFGSDSGSPVFAAHRGLESRESHPSDVRRLETEHATAGYREGITAAKATSIQAGFDEGFSLGATIGLKAGQLLGYLEGIAGALRAAGGEDFQHASLQLQNARRELSTDMIFTEQYWNSDGTWKYEIEGLDNGSGGDIVFEDVASGHPVISKWAEVVKREEDRWVLNGEVLD